MITVFYEAVPYIYKRVYEQLMEFSILPIGLLLLLNIVIQFCFTWRETASLDLNCA